MRHHPLDDPQIMALAAAIQDMAAGPEPATLAMARAFREEISNGGAAALSDLEEARHSAAELAGSWPQLEEIAACYAAGPEDPCAFCESGGLTHIGDSEPVPAWVEQARDVKATAARTLEAIALAMEPDPGDVALSRPPPPPPDHLLPEGLHWQIPIPRLSHKHVRDSIPLEGHRLRIWGHDDPALPEPPPSAPEPEDRRRSRRRYRR